MNYCYCCYSDQLLVESHNNHTTTIVASTVIFLVGINYFVLKTTTVAIPNYNSPSHFLIHHTHSYCLQDYINSIHTNHHHPHNKALLVIVDSDYDAISVTTLANIISY